MNPLRRHLAPLAAESISPLNLPPVRMGLLTKLNLLTVGLIFLTAIATTGLYVWKEWRLSEAELRAQGSTLVGMLAEATEHGLATDDRDQPHCHPRQPRGRGRRRVCPRARREPAHDRRADVR